MSNIKYIIKNNKIVHPKIPDGCIGFWDFTLQKNTDNNRTMTPDLSGHGHHMYHNNMLFDEVKLERLQNSTLHSEVVSKNSKGYHVYKYTPKTRASDSILYYDLVSGRTIKDTQTVTVTIYAKYEGNADKLKPSIRIYKFEDESSEDIDLSGMVTLNETMERDSEGFYKLTASYTNNTGADITNVSFLVYCANSTTSYLEDGHKPVTYFYIDSIDDGVTSLRSGFFPQNSGEGGLYFDGIDDNAYTNPFDISEIIANNEVSMYMEINNINNAEGRIGLGDPSGRWAKSLLVLRENHYGAWHAVIGGFTDDTKLDKINISKDIIKNTKKAILNVTKTEFQIYLDGKLRKIYRTFDMEYDQTLQRIIVGRAYDTGNSYLQGGIKKLAIFSRALYSTEIEQIFEGDSIG